MNDPGNFTDQLDPILCPACQSALEFYEITLGRCANCERESWTPEKRDAVDRLIGLAFRKGPPNPGEIGRAIEEARRTP
jgi:hypothetical protein